MDATIPTPDRKKSLHKRICDDSKELVVVVSMICYKLPSSYFKSPWLFLEWEVGPTYLQISLLKARPLPDPIDMGSTILDESSGFKLAGCSQSKSLKRSPAVGLGWFWVDCQYWKKRVWADYEQILRVFFSCFQKQFFF